MRLNQILRTSAIFRAADKASARVARAAELSAAGAAAAATRDRWQRLSWREQRRMAGTTLLVATGVHITLSIWAESPHGWQWLIVPGIVAMLGGLLVVASLGPAEPS